MSDNEDTFVRHLLDDTLPSESRAPDQDATAPRTIGGFEIRGLLGSGGMGSVYWGVAPDGSRAAIKLAHAHLGLQTDRFDREARVRIDHPNVVRVLDAGDVDGRPYIAFEYLTGEALDRRLRRGRLSPEEAIRIGADVCAGLEAAHASNVVHRDLKPANLFILEDGTTKILDFGIARVEWGTRLTQAGSIIGTPAYLSPEQARGSLDIDHRADIWSLGVVLYECLTGTCPFARESIMASLVAVIMMPAEPIGRLAPQVPAGLAAAVERALEKEPAARWRDARMFAEQLARSLVATPPRRPTSFPSDERRVVAILLLERVLDMAAVETAIARYGGDVVPLLDRRALAVFGGELSRGNEAERALRAAAAVRGFAEKVAVAHGRATVRGDGLEGEVVDQAEALLAQPGDGIAVAAPIARVLGSMCAEIGPDRFELAADAVFEARIESAPLVGREAEQAEIKTVLRTFSEEHRAIILLMTGPPGLGKSRLLRELEASLRAMMGVEGCSILRASAEPLRKHEAMALVASLSTRNDPLSTASETLEDRPGSDPRIVADRMRASVLGELLEATAKGPLAILLDDLQWSDEDSLTILGDLAEQASDRALLIACGSRETKNEFGELLADVPVRRLEPRPLSLSETKSLVSLLSRRDVDDELARAIHDRTEGNPFFVEQVVLSLRGVTDPRRVPLPPTVEGAVQARLDALAPPEKELLKRTALLNRPFTSEDATWAGADVAALDSLVQKGLLRRGRGSDREVRHRFQSTLVAEVAAELLPAEAKRRIHGEIARALEAGGGAPAELAYHHQRAGDRARAGRWCVVAAHDAALRADSRSVLELSARALELGAELTDPFLFHTDLAAAHRFLGDLEVAERELVVAASHARDDSELGSIEVERASILFTLGRKEQSRMLIESAVELVRSSGGVRLALALGRRALIHAWSGAIDRAKADLAEARPLVVVSGSVPLSALAAGWDAQIAAQEGELGTRLEAFERAVKLYTAAGDLRHAAGANSNLADTYNRFGAYGMAEQALVRALEGCRQIGHRLIEGYALANLAYARTMLGHAEDALRILDEASAISQQTRQPDLSLLVLLYRARALFRLRRLKESIAVAEALSEEARFLGSTAKRAAAMAVEAAVLLEREESRDALVVASTAMKLRDDLGGLEEDEAELFLVLAEALHANGASSEASRVIERGRERIQSVARRIADETWRARFLEVPAHARLLGDQGPSRPSSPPSRPVGR